MSTFDDILEEAGTFGRYQKRIFALLCLAAMPWSGVYVGIVFQGFTPDHWCRHPAVERVREGCGWRPRDTRALAPPGDSRCRGYERWNGTRLTCDGANLTGDPTVPCSHGWVYDYEGRRSFVTEFDLVCADAWLVDMYQATLNVGFLGGSFASGYLADRFGRKLVFLLCNLLAIISGVLVAVAPNYIAVLVFRILYGFGVKGQWVAGFVLITELVGVEHRKTVGIIFQFFFSVGLMFLPLVAYLITDWRWIQVAITAPYILFMSYYWLIPESPRWLLSQNYSKKAAEVTKAIAKENKKTLTKNIEVCPNLIHSLTVDSAKASLMDLVRTPKMRKHTFILSFSWFTCAVVYAGLIMILGIQGGNVYMDFVVTGLVEFPAAFFILVTIERVGRRWPYAVANVGSGLACLIAVFVPDDMHWFKIAVACVGRLGITMAFEMVTFVNAELYPTFVRNLGVAVCSTLSDVGGIFAPFLLYRLAVIWMALPIIIFGFLAIIAGGLVLLLPETKGMPLPETIDDIEHPDRYLGVAGTCMSW
uniref:Solute carrier family 22 member 3 n=1 Tax=Denticeps clupeoides TaxID=299321 RepID=A0AAY4BX23_9TELE